MALKAGRPSGRTQDHIDQARRQMEDSAEEKRLNVRMTKSEYQRLKRFALERDMTISDVVREALSDYMSK